LPRITIDTDYDAHVEYSEGAYTRYATTSSVMVGEWLERVNKVTVEHDYRGAFRFPLGALPADAIVNQVRLGLNVIIAGGAGHLTDIHPYNGDGQADPELDSDADFYARTAVGVEYINDSTALRTTGWKWFDLGAQALTDVQNAKVAVNRFSLGIHEEGDNDELAEIEAIEHVDPNHARLEITYNEFWGGSALPQLEMAKAVLRSFQPWKNRFQKLTPRMF